MQKNVSEKLIYRLRLLAWELGQLVAHGKVAGAPQDDHESEDTIKRALDPGINWIDTAAAYGLGHSEEVVGSVKSFVYLGHHCGGIVNLMEK